MSPRTASNTIHLLVQPSMSGSTRFPTIYVSGYAQTDDTFPLCRTGVYPSGTSNPMTPFRKLSSIPKENFRRVVDILKNCIYQAAAEMNRVMETTSKMTNSLRPCSMPE